MGKRMYNMKIATAKEKKAGTDEDVWIAFRGTTGWTASFHLDKGGYDDFEKGDDDFYQVYTEDVGDVTHIAVGLLGEGKYEGAPDLAKDAGLVAKKNEDVIDEGIRTIKSVTGTGRGHSSPMWKLDRVVLFDGYEQVTQKTNDYIRRLTGQEYMTFTQRKDERVFTAMAWVNDGQVLVVAKD